MKHLRMKNILRCRPKPLWIVIPAHIVALGLSLCIFALPHHVIPQERKSLGVQSFRENVTAPVETAVSDISVEAMALTEASEAPVVIKDATRTSSAVLSGDFSEKFADKFITGDPVVTEDSYISENINIQVQDYYIEGTDGKKGISYFVADFYIRDISCLQNAFAKDKYGRNITEPMSKVMARADAKLMMNGDFYGVREGGICIRNGQLYSLGEIVRDIGVLYWDGTFKCFSSSAFDYETAMRDGAYQAWNFGPALLNEDGTPRTDLAEFYSDIIKNQPRSAFGYFEPGHYCFICVDGRSDISRGMTLPQLAKIAEELGLTQCYNLDGGQTAVLGFMKKLVNEPGAGSRDCSDYICVVDRVTE